MARYHLETSAVQAFMMQWELNMPHTVTENTPGEVCVSFKCLTFQKVSKYYSPQKSFFEPSPCQLI